MDEFININYKFINNNSPLYPINPFSFYTPGCSKNLFKKLENICPICYENLSDKISYLSPCRHIFCPDCIDTWKKQRFSCPLCRAKINSINII